MQKYCNVYCVSVDARKATTDGAVILCYITGC